ncbi:hypothetical protein DFH08DRAFT_850460 [Mycena albidolilacea]|uniref:Uncharacterized protein n=1 Tax=Mycena albidolilacea TaxID=1033008 RepID=A0AAD7EZ44_9AGAR|nr:hypothetical protein DFH08DRAFT_850460 [Mycena albidolilacea]
MCTQSLPRSDSKISPPQCGASTCPGINRPSEVYKGRQLECSELRSPLTTALIMKFSTAFAFAALTLAPSAFALPQIESLPTIIPTLGPPSRSISFPLSIISTRPLPSFSLSVTSLSSLSATSAPGSSAPPSDSASSPLSSATTPPTSPSSPSLTLPVPSSSGADSSSPAAPSTTAPNGARSMGAAGQALAVTLGAGLLAAVLI